MLPRPQQRLLHDVLRALPVTTGEMHGVPQQRPGVLGIQRTHKDVVRYDVGASPACFDARHTQVNAPSGPAVHDFSRKVTAT
jgi:hypothetical protein